MIFNKRAADAIINETGLELKIDKLKFLEMLNEAVEIWDIRNEAVLPPHKQKKDLERVKKRTQELLDVMFQ